MQDIEAAVTEMAGVLGDHVRLTAFVTQFFLSSNSEMLRRALSASQRETGMTVRSEMPMPNWAHTTSVQQNTGLLSQVGQGRVRSQASLSAGDVPQDLPESFHHEFREVAPMLNLAEADRGRPSTPLNVTIPSTTTGTSARSRGPITPLPHQESQSLNFVVSPGESILASAGAHAAHSAIYGSQEDHGDAREFHAKDTECEIDPLLFIRDSPGADEDV